MDADLIRFIKEEVKKQVNIILSGAAGTNDSQTETISNLYPGSPDIPARPVMHPYGLTSRAPAGTIQVTARQGEHPGNRMILGHRDGARPEVESGETILYNQFGQQIYLENGKIHIGKKTTSNPAPVGNELKAYILAELAWLKTHTHIITVPGVDSFPPTQLADLEEIQADNIDNDEILSDYIFVEKTP